ncbi:MAG: hypothetical protein ACT6U0_06650 [Shinella sp.]|uniref:hypothetical protein n=1 Tax=Shinella sp. TaxID=1870904 RepID=UPI0040367AE0
MIGKLILMAAFMGLALPAAAAARPLDPLLEGFDDACAYSDALASLLQSSYAFARKEGTLSIPAGYEALFGPPSVKPENEYLKVTLPVVDGTWRGVPVKEIEVYITELESGFNYHAVLFQPEALKAAEATFKARGIAAKKKLSAQDDSGFGWDTGFAIIDGAPRYQCDLST